MEHQSVKAFMRTMRTHAASLTRQQMKTLRGQALSGDIDGTIKGLERLLRRKE